jgi:hypothetical protein
MKVDVYFDFVVPPLIVPTRTLISAADMENSCFGNGVKLRYMGVSTDLTNCWSQPLTAVMTSSQHVYETASSFLCARSAEKRARNENQTTTQRPCYRNAAVTVSVVAR